MEHQHDKLDPHRRNQLVSIDFHRIVASRLDDEIIENARLRARWQLEFAPVGSGVAESLEKWLVLLDER